VGLKGGNRGRFERRLEGRILEGLASAGLSARAAGRGGRIVVTAGERPSDADLQRALAVLRWIPGVSNVSVAVAVPSEIGAIADAAAEALAAAPPGSFKVETRRADKSFPLGSIEISRAVAPVCIARSPRPVDVHDPAVTVRVEVTTARTYVSAARHAGPGGLPVGSAAPLLAFLSGGLDSAVAAFLMARRGARVVAVHFHNRSHEGNAVLEKLEDLCGILAWSTGRMPLLVVPFEACQRAIVAAVPAPYRMLVYRRAMLRIGAHLAASEGALGFVTGDSLGQVASQTAENLRTIHAVATLPVYAPLVGSDKAEIVRWAREIGTYDVSIRPHADCCSFLIAAHPATKSAPEEVLALEAPLDWDALVEEAVRQTPRQVLLPDPAVLAARTR
jgi:thiamine biosynthesis protein ThiI